MAPMQLSQIKSLYFSSFCFEHFDIIKCNKPRGSLIRKSSLYNIHVCTVCIGRTTLTYTVDCDVTINLLFVLAYSNHLSAAKSTL